MLRAFRYVYRWFEYILSFVCAITNDISLLAVEVVQESAVTKGEDMLEPFRSFDSGLDGGSSSSLLLPGNGGDRLKQVAEYQPSEDSDQSWLIYTVITPILVIILYSINILHILLAHFCADITDIISGLHRCCRPNCFKHEINQLGVSSFKARDHIWWEWYPKLPWR